MGPVKDSKWSLAQNLDFEVPSTFLALKMALAWRLVPFNRAKKVSGNSKSLDFVPGPFRILEMAP